MLMPTDAQPSAQLPVEEQPRSDAPKRLPGLWVTCVLFGLTGMLCVSLVFMATPLGMGVFGALAIAQFAAGIALWRRSRMAWQCAVALSVLYALGFVGMGAARLVHVPTAVAVVVPSLAVLIYLLARRKCFSASARSPGPRTAPGAAALLIVLLLGGAWLFVAGPDDSLRSFDFGQAPRPQVDSPDNAYPLLLQAVAGLGARDKELLGALRGEWRDKAGSVSDEWRTKTKALLEANRVGLELLSQVTERPYFAAPLMNSTVDLDAQLDWMSGARYITHLTCLEAEFEMAQGNRDKAVAAALRAVRFGMELSRYPDAMIQWLVGNAIVSIGLGSVRELAAAPAAGSQEPWRRAIQDLQLDDKLKEGFRTGLSAEVGFIAMSAHEMASEPGSFLPKEASRRAALMRALLVRPHPLLKPNMMANQMGGYFADLARSLDMYPGPATYKHTGPLGLPRGGPTSFLQWARDPMGSFEAELIQPVIGRARDECLRSVAQAHMTQIFLALRCYQLEHGKLPEALDALAPEYLMSIPLDPFTDKPFGYEPTGQKPRIWSVGPDLVAGKSTEEGGDDVVVELEFAPPPAAK